jgi:NAD(P)-dependent dehydrogenase (short-subunit alcohol dehydrogenase family)
MNASLAGKVAIVTGAGGDVGSKIVGRFVEEGAAVMATDFSPEAVAKAVGDLTGETGLVIQHKHDVTSEASWQEVVNTTVSKLGHVEILVNCAGALQVELIETMSLETWRRIMSVNCDGAFLGIKSALPHLREAAKKSLAGAAVINIASAQGLKAGLPGLTAYTASKGALRLLTRTAAVEFGRLGYRIRCNAIVPSAMRGTAMMNKVIDLQVKRGMFSSFDQGLAALDQGHPSGRAGEPIDVANAAVFLASDAAKHITGIDLPVDGGVCA